MKNIVIKLIWFGLFSVVLLAGKIYHDIFIWSYSGADVSFEIQQGDGFARINGNLAKQDLIKSAKIFHRYSQVNNFMTSFKPGAYTIKSGMTMVDIIDLFIEGKVQTTSVTIPEGKNLYDIAKILGQADVVDENHFIQAAKDSSYAKELKVPGDSFEGYLYPDTYFLIPGTSPKSIMKAMVDNFRRKTQDIDFSHPTLNPHEIIVLASIVEKETGAAHERPIIAGVFHNRLRKRMRLQSDPTTIYGIYEQYKGNLRKKHLLEKTPYNTYKIPALPIGPISNPGMESIKATLNPDQHQYLYFVSHNDGTHAFAKTYKEHLRNVDKWQKTRANREGRSWRDLNKK